MTSIVSGTNTTETSYSIPIAKLLGIGTMSKPIYTSSNTSLDAISSVQIDNLYVKGEALKIKGSLIEAKNDITVDTHKLDIGTVQLSDSYGDESQSHSNTTHLSSSIKANNISLSATGNTNITSGNLEANNDIALFAGENISLNAASNSSMDKITTTTYKKEEAKDFDFTETTTTTTATHTSNTHLSNNLKANNIHINSGSSIEAYNLALQANNEISMNAKDNLTLSNLADTSSTEIQVHQKTSGFKFSVGENSYSAFIGKQTTDTHQKNKDSIHYKQNIQGSSISISSGKDISIQSNNLIADSGDISLNADNNISISSLEDEHSFSEQTKTTSNGFEISIPKAYAKEVGIASAKSTINGLGKGLEWIGDSLDLNNPNNKNHIDHPNFFRKPGKWLQGVSNKIKSPSFSEINHIQVGVGFSHQSTTSSTSSSSSQASSSNILGDNIIINAKNKADILGSNLESKNNVAIEANKVSIASAKNQSDTSNSNSSDTFNVNVSADIGKDTSLQAQAQFDHSEHKDSSSKITQVASNLSSKNLYIKSKENTDIIGSHINAEDSTDIKAKTFSLSSSENKFSTDVSDSSYGGAIKVSYKGSFEGEASGHYNDSSNTTENITHNTSVLNTKKLSIQTNQDSHIIGSHINTKEADIQSQSLNISAIEDSFTSSSKNSSASALIGGSLINLTSLNLKGNIDKSSNSENSTTHNNATLNSENLKLTTQKDLNIKGGHIATQNLQANIKGDMNIESLQDTHNEERKDFKLASSINTNSFKSFKPSFGYSPSSSHTQDIKTQSGINVQNSLQINVDGNADLKGAYINTDNKQKDTASFTSKTNTLSSADITNASHVKSFKGIKGYEEQNNTSKTLASISNNIDLEQNTNIQTQEPNIHRISPSNETLKKVSLPNTDTKEEKSIFDTLVEKSFKVQDVFSKTFNLASAMSSNHQKNVATNKPNENFKDKFKQGLKNVNKGIDIAYNEGRASLSSVGELIGEDGVKKVTNNINDYISLTHNTKELSKGVSQAFNQSFKQNMKDAYTFAKPLSDSITDIGINNTTDVVGSLIKNEVKKNHKAPKDIFKDAWKNTQTQSKNALDSFTHKMLWE